jgi:hypothetical protein
MTEREAEREAFPMPSFKYLTIKEDKVAAGKIEQDLRSSLVEGKFENIPREYHNSSLIQCLIRTSWESHAGQTPEEFKDLNRLLIGDGLHKAIAAILPGAVAEAQFTQLDHFDADLIDRLRNRPDPITILFTIDVFRQRTDRKASMIYEIKVKEDLDGLYDAEFIKKLPPGKLTQTNQNVTPAAVYVNQVLPYEVAGDSEFGRLIYIPKEMFDPVIIYKISMPDVSDRRAVQETLVQRAEKMVELQVAYEKKNPLDLTIIEPSGICRQYCTFGKKGVFWETKDGEKQQCPVYLLPTDTEIKRAPKEIVYFYQNLMEAVQKKMTPLHMIFLKHFYYASVKKPELVTLTLPEIQMESRLKNPATVRTYLARLEKWRYVKPTTLDGQEAWEVVPVRDYVRRGWGTFLYGDHYPTIVEAPEEAEGLENVMADRVIANTWLPYDYKGLFGCARLQYFTNSRQIIEGLKNNLEQSKLWFIDLAIWSNLVNIACNPSKETQDFEGYNFHYYKLNANYDIPSHPVLWVPIGRTEWRVITPRRSIPKNPKVTPMAKHAYQAGLLSAINGGEPVYVGYYPRRKMGDIRFYEVKAEDPEALLKLGRENIGKIKDTLEGSWPIANDFRVLLEQELQRIIDVEGLSEVEAFLKLKQIVRKEHFPASGIVCRWCVMKYKCDEGRQLLSWLELKIGEEPEEEESGEFDLRTF